MAFLTLSSGLMAVRGLAVFAVIAVFSVGVAGLVAKTLAG